MTQCFLYLIIINQFFFQTSLDSLRYDIIECIHIFMFFLLLREAAKKVLFLMAGPLRPKPPPNPRSLWQNLFFIKQGNLKDYSHALGLILVDFKQLIGGRKNPFSKLATFAELKSQWRMFKRQFSRFGYVWDEEARAAKIATAIQCTVSRSGEFCGSQ